MKRFEKDYYPAVIKWFKEECKCTKAGTYIFNNSALLSADIVGWKEDTIAYACELKPYPLPVGASGYGAIGQAFMLKKYVKKVYVACVATNREELIDGPVIFWKIIMGRRSVRQLLKAHNIEFPDYPVFIDYQNVAKKIFLNYFSATDLGFLIVHEKDARENIDSSYEVIELVKPKR